MKFSSFSLQNIRCLNEATEFQIKPLTIVVGANSSGKSTFVRALPLLRQSIEKLTRGPILWYGHYVDFGDFETVLNRHSNSRDITFSFKFELEKDQKRPTYAMRHATLLEPTEADISIELTKDEPSVGVYLKRLSIKIFGINILAAAQPDGIITELTVNGISLQAKNVNLCLRTGESLFSCTTIKKPSSEDSELDGIWGSRAQGPFHDQIVSHLKGIFHGATGRGKIANVARRLGLGSATPLLNDLRDLAQVTAWSADKARRLTVHSPWLKRLQALVIADRLNMLLNRIDSYLASCLRGVRYIGPTRATAERFYRQQDLAVDEVDPQGSNLAMFMMGLNEEERSDFSSWCAQRLGFKIMPETEGSHVSIYLSESEDGEMFNIADMGFGYSQILPVAASLWKSGKDRDAIAQARKEEASLYQRDLASSVTLVVEQPELHLHPRIQAKFAELVAALANDPAASELNLICETHSETIINRIGILIADGLLEPEKVQVLIFEKMEDGLNSRVSTAQFSASGTLENWPYGFFLPAE